ncbi:MAG: YaiI/YqxD family protein [Geminicoccaceae bacterium]|nr:MAG: YaiI/YqxD family protein [Geminicoccaceae bacterium]
MQDRGTNALSRIFLDADACPVKDETFRVAGRYGLVTLVVSNAYLRLPASPLIELVLVEAGLDRADDWIADAAQPGDVVVTSDIPLAHRCVTKGVRTLGPTGRAFTEASIGNDLATRDLLTTLRDTGQIRGGGRPFTKQDRSRFLGALDAAIQAIKRTGR